MNLFLFGTFWFWAVIAVFTVFLTICIETAKATPAIILTLIVGTLLYQNYAVFTLQEWLLFGVLYLIAGLIWAIFKWFLYCKQWVREQNRGEHKYFYAKDTLSASDHKERITLWIVYFPLSIVWTVARDVVKNGLSRICDCLSGIFDKIAENAKKGLKNEKDN